MAYYSYHVVKHSELRQRETFFVPEHSMTTVCGISVYQSFCGGSTIKIGMGKAKDSE